MDAGTAAAVVGTALGAVGLPITSFLGFKQLRSATAADQERAEEKKAEDIEKAEQRGRRDCERALVEMTNDRNYWRGKHDALQTLITERGLKGES